MVSTPVEIVEGTLCHAKRLFAPACSAPPPLAYPADSVFGGLYAPMLARLDHRLPTGDVWRYEPKLDGFRGLLWHAPSGSVHLLSRNLKDLSHAFLSCYGLDVICRSTPSSTARS